MTTDIDDQATVVADAGPVSTSVDGEEVILHPETGTYHGLNDVGTEIWERIQDPTPVEDLATAIAAEYDAADERVRSDVESFLADLLAADLIRVDEETA